MNTVCCAWLDPRLSRLRFTRERLAAGDVFSCVSLECFDIDSGKQLEASLSGTLEDDRECSGKPFRFAINSVF